MRLPPLIVLRAALTTIAPQNAAGEGAAASYTHPVFDEDFPDPTVIDAGGGWFYAYATQGDVAGRVRNFQVSRSRDLVRWERVGDALPVKPSWALRSPPRECGAPLRLGLRPVTDAPPAAPTLSGEGGGALSLSPRLQGLSLHSAIAGIE